MASFEKAAIELLKIEGGYHKDPSDPGGATNFGISQRSYPDLDLSRLTVGEAKAIYLRDFWQPLRCGEIAGQELAEELFKAGVNMGHYPAVKCLQEAILQLRPSLAATMGAVDGIMGPKTLAAIKQAKPRRLLLALYELRLIRYYAGLKNFNVYAKGWVHRVMDS